ncbi:hypothetical protein M378DRAFT_92481 [Amanita muscaria Koide BX008]|uniref:Uncharacterized protein n=1 Tax=Amanita muscaria (strain Koide BX008) TaxID=946122 RepID=A0A0C2WD24_AMAMK|nr:hypothetical protein M378DRAFT_92481 [Amanita muscaria Koide BX008]
MSLLASLFKAKPPATKSKKRSHQDDIPPEADGKDTQLKAYNQLECTIRCEAHHGHCFIDCVNGLDNHQRLDHAQMTLWAKKISLGQATIYNPPHCLNFDHGPAKKPRLSGSISSIPEVHITIQNISPEASAVPSPSSFSASSVFPPVSDVIKMIEVDKPGKGFDHLLYAMLEAGMVTSDQILLVPEDVLSMIGVMGQARARILRNYARRVVLPMLGLAGKYEEPEIALDQDH